MKFFKLHPDTFGALPMYRISVIDSFDQETGATLSTPALGNAAEINHWCDLVKNDIERIRKEALSADAKLRERIAKGDIPPLFVGKK